MTREGDRVGLQAVLEVRIPAGDVAQLQELGDLVMEELLQQAGVSDPIVNTDDHAAELAISFEFDAVGDVQIDSERALSLLSAAMDRMTERLVDRIAGSAIAGIDRVSGSFPIPPGSLQYPLAGVGAI